MKKLLSIVCVCATISVVGQQFDPIKSDFGISVGPLGRFDGNGAGLSNVVASGSGGWTGNPNQFSATGGNTNLKSDLLLTNLNLYYSVTDPLKVYYFGDAGAANIAFIHSGTNQFYLMGVDTVGVGMANYDQSKYAVLEETGNFVLGGGGSFSGSGSSLTALNASALSSGTVATARLGSGTANSSTFLRGDNTWASVASSTNQFWVAASPPNEKYTNLFGNTDEISGAYRVLTVGTNVGNNVQISDGISSFPNGMWIDAGAQEYFVGKISVGTSRGQFQLGSGAVSNLTATGVIYAPSNNISGGISAGSIAVGTSPIKITIDGTTGVGGFAGDLYLTNRAANKILRTDANKGTAEVTVGSGLSFDGTTLTASGGSSTTNFFSSHAPIGSTNQYSSGLLWSTTIPGGSIGTNGSVVVTALVQAIYSGGGNSQLDVKYGSTTVATMGWDSSGWFSGQRTIMNDNSEAATVCFGNTPQSFAVSSSAGIASTFNTTTNFTLGIYLRSDSSIVTNLIRGIDVKINGNN